MSNSLNHHLYQFQLKFLELNLFLHLFQFLKHHLLLKFLELYQHLRQLR